MTDVVRLLLVGDIELGGEYAGRCGADPSGWTTPFADVRPVFRDADLSVGNLESPLSRGSEPRRKRNLLSAPSEAVAALSYLGFTALSLANNHITDHGSDGIARTCDILGAHQIYSFGAGETLEAASRPAFARARDLCFGFLGYAVADRDVAAEAATQSREGCVPLSLDRLEHDIAEVRTRADHVIVSVHWGYQYDRYPDPGQIEMAHKIIDLGALIVHGHHPHVLQGMERYGNGLILYSLGNFFFPDFVRTDGRRFRFPRQSRRTAAVRCDVDSSGVHAVSVVPLVVGSGFRMQVLRGCAATRAVASFAAMSRSLSAPDYGDRWRTHHARTERWRRRHDERARLHGDTARIWNRARARGLTGVIVKLRVGHVMELLRLALRHVRIAFR